MAARETYVQRLDTIFGEVKFIKGAVRSLLPGLEPLMVVTKASVGERDINLEYDFDPTGRLGNYRLKVGDRMERGSPLELVIKDMDYRLTDH